MALDSSNVRSWAGSGGAFIDLTNQSTLPTNSTSPLAADFDDVGYLSDAGVSVTEDADTTKIFAWQNGANVRTIQSTHDITFSFAMLEMNDLTQEVFFGNQATQGNDSVSKITGKQQGRHPWVIQAFDEDEVIRIVIPDGQITEKGDWSLLNTAGTEFPITISAYPDSTGVKAYIYRSVMASS